MPFVLRLAIVGLLLAGRDAAAQTVLAWKFEPGQSFRIEQKIKQKQSVTVLDQRPLGQQHESTWLIRFTVKDATTLQATFEKTQSKFTGEASKDGTVEPLGDQLEGCRFTLTVAATGEVSKVAGLDEFWDKAAGGDAAKRKALREAFSEKAFLDRFTDMLGPLPAKAVSPKDTWKRETTGLIPHFGSFLITQDFRLEGEVDGKQSLRYSVEASYQLPKKADPEIFRIVKASLKAQDGKGSIVFDAAKGRLVSHQRSVSLRGSFDIEAAGRVRSVDFTSEDSVAIRLVD